jgi:hypothetical protein
MKKFPVMSIKCKKCGAVYMLASLKNGVTIDEGFENEQEKHDNNKNT